MLTASTWPLDFFLQDLDTKGFLHASKDTKAWWAVQKLTGFHCHCCKTFEDDIANISNLIPPTAEKTVWI
jgi:hypothetical protein